MIKIKREEKMVQVLNGWKELKVIKIRKGIRGTISLYIAWLWENYLKFFVIGIGTLILFAIVISLSALLTFLVVTSKMPVVFKVFIFLISPFWMLFSLLISGLIAVRIYEIFLGPMYETLNFFATLPIQENLARLPASPFRSFLDKYSIKKRITGWLIDRELLEISVNFHQINPEKFKEAIKKARNKKELFYLFALVERR